ncbi:MAG: DNA repair protein RecO [Lachnospiraceae bacterium]|nr:DNA repair protein RecO [Lachnospiraceae bacterium]
MRETVEVTGVVLGAQPVGDYDRRLVILTRERGKITAFARGARRPKSQLIAVTSPFVFARFSLFEGRDAYTLSTAEAAEFFLELTRKMPGVLYGYYFLELASYYGREGIEASEMVSLIYMSLKAILREKMSPDLVRRIYELRMMTVNGDYAPPEEGREERYLTAGAAAALRYTAWCPIEKLFSFALSTEAEDAYCRAVSEAVRRTVDKSFKSLAVIDKMR